MQEWKRAQVKFIRVAALAPVKHGGSTSVSIYERLQVKNICISSWKSTDWSQRFHYKPKRWNTVSGLLRPPPKQKPGRYGMQGWSNPPASVSRMGLGGGESREEIARVHSLCPGHAAAQLHSISLLQLIWLAVVGQRYVNQSK